jgi:probable HAF family extracellular repeat protein
MKSIATLIAASGLFAALATAQPAPLRYTVTDLGTFGGSGTNSAAYDMNNAGWVAGSANLTPGGPQHAFLWYGGGQLKDLGTLGGPNSEAGGPNASGEAALISDTATVDPNGEDFCGFGTHLQCLAAIWKNGSLTALPTLPGGQNSQSYGLNNKGQVIGFSENGVPDSDCLASVPFQAFRFQAVRWEPNGEPKVLRPLDGDTVGFAFGINGAGQAVGSSGLCSNTSLPPVNPAGAHAVLWELDGSPTDLGNLGGSINVATSVNDRGEVVGGAQSTDGAIHAFLWSKHTGMQDLGTLPGAFVTVPPCCNAINDRGDVIGFSCDPSGCHAMLWKDKKAIDLNTLIPAGSPWYLLSANSINNAGEIIGGGLINGEVHAFLATPTGR